MDTGPAQGTVKQARTGFAPRRIVDAFAIPIFGSRRDETFFELSEVLSAVSFTEAELNALALLDEVQTAGGGSESLSLASIVRRQLLIERVGARSSRPFLRMVPARGLRGNDAPQVPACAQTPAQPLCSRSHRRSLLLRCHGHHDVANFERSRKRQCHACENGSYFQQWTSRISNT